jgi:hypothetical protein
MHVVERIGVERFPATGMSYNAAAFQSGRLYEGQPVTRRGAHTLNDEQRSKCPVHGGSLTAPSWNLNVTARAIVLPQNVGDVVTDAQVDAVARWGAALILAGEVKRGARWCGHRCVSSKDCPGSHGFERIPEIQRLTEHYVANGLDDMTISAEDRAAIAQAVYDKLRVTSVTNKTDEPDPQARDATAFELGIVATRRAYAVLGILQSNVVPALTALTTKLDATAKSEQVALTGLATQLRDATTGIAGGVGAVQAKVDQVRAAVDQLTDTLADLSVELDAEQLVDLQQTLADSLPSSVLHALLALLQPADPQAKPVAQYGIGGEHVAGTGTDSTTTTPAGTAAAPTTKERPL